MTLSFLAMLLRVAALLLTGFAGFCLFLYWRQEAMLFFLGAIFFLALIFPSAFQGVAGGACAKHRPAT